MVSFLGQASLQLAMATAPALPGGSLPLSP